MKCNEYGQPLGASGYANSILQDDLSYCFKCGKTTGKIDRHEVFQGVAYRKKSKEHGLWVMLCHESCHEGKDGVHGNRAFREELSAYAQKRAQETYGWTVDEWRERFGKNWI